MFVSTSSIWSSEIHQASRWGPEGGPLGLPVLVGQKVEQLAVLLLHQQMVYCSASTGGGFEGGPRGGLEDGVVFVGGFGGLFGGADGILWWPLGGLQAVVRWCVWFTSG